MLLKIPHGAIKIILAVTFVAALFASKYALVDNSYKYSLEPDSEACVEEARSFYFFFKNPSTENVPHQLTSYPNYSDGQFISTALLANAVRVLSKTGIIQTELSDNDFSIIIFSMRWLGLLLNALTVALVFMCLVLVSGNWVLSFTICLLYYFFNIQTLLIDFARTDYYTLFSANLVFTAALFLFYHPHKSRYYILSGIAAGLVSATKINFPFYLLLPAIIVLLLMVRKKVSIRHFIYMALAFLATFCFMYFRWLLYAENVYDVLKVTMGIGEDWFVFWGNNNYTYYLWDQFFDNQFSIAVLVFLLFFYASFTWCLVTGILQRNTLRLTLCGVFILQMVFLAFSPKVPRYAIIVPTYVAVFIALTLLDWLKLVSNQWVKVALPILILLPVFGNGISNYLKQVKAAREKEISITQTRLPAYKWIGDNIKPGSVVAVQGNGILYNFPFYLNMNYFMYPFLYKDMLCDFMPPDMNMLKNTVSYLVLNDKEKDFHFFSIKYHQCDSVTLQSWSTFYTQLDSLYPPVRFSSAYKNYGVGQISIYPVNPALRNDIITQINASSIVDSSKVLLKWNYDYIGARNADCFELQIAEDSTLQWLVYGSRDGFMSKYRHTNAPVQTNNVKLNLVPPLVKQAFNDGQFEKAIGWKNYNEHAKDIEPFFADILVAMKQKGLTFGESFNLYTNNGNPALNAVVASIYQAQGDIMQMHIDEYLKLALPHLNAEEVKAYLSTNSSWQFAPPVKLQKGKTYYWRVRYRNVYTLVSNWSNTSVFIY